MILDCRVPTQKTKDLAEGMNVPIHVANIIISDYMESHQIADESLVNIEQFREYWLARTVEEQLDRILSVPTYDVVEPKDGKFSMVRDGNKLTLKRPAVAVREAARIDFLSSFPYMNIPGVVDELRSNSDIERYLLYVDRINSNYPHESKERKDMMALDLLKQYHHLKGYAKYDSFDLVEIVADDLISSNNVLRKTEVRANISTRDFQDWVNSPLHRVVFAILKKSGITPRMLEEFGKNQFTRRRFLWHLGYCKSMNSINNVDYTQTKFSMEDAYTEANAILQVVSWFTGKQYEPIILNRTTSNTNNTQIQGDNISTNGKTDLAKKLTNPGNNIGVEYKGKKFRNAEHAYQTWKSGEFDEVAYENGNKGQFKPKGSKPVNTATNYQTMVDIITAKLQQHPELVEETKNAGGMEFLNASYHSVTGDSYWETQGNFMKALKEAYSKVTGEELASTPSGVNNSPVTKIISGGQTGVDTIGLEVAASLGIETGGTAPKGYQGEDKNHNNRAIGEKYGLVEITDEQQKEHTAKTGKTDAYTGRTYLNVANADATVIFSTDRDSLGTQATINAASLLGKPKQVNPSSPQALANWLALNNVKTLNVAGNRGSALTEAEKKRIEKFLRDALTLKPNDKGSTNVVGHGVSSRNYRKEDPINHPEINFIFGDNAQAYTSSQGMDQSWIDKANYLSGDEVRLNVNGSAAIIRTDAQGNVNQNAIGIPVKKYQQSRFKTQFLDEKSACFTDTDAALFKRLCNHAFQRIDDSDNMTTVWPSEIALKRAGLPRSLADWLCDQLINRFGLDAQVWEHNKENDPYKGLFGIKLNFKDNSNEVVEIDNNNGSFSAYIAMRQLPKPSTDISIDNLPSNDNVEVTKSSKSTIAKMSLLMDSATLNNRMNNIASQLSAQVDTFVEWEIMDLEDELAEDPTNGDLYSKILKVQNAETGRQYVIQKRLDSILYATKNFFLEKYELISSLNDEEAADEFGAEVEDIPWYREQYKIMAENFEDLLKLAASKIQDSEQVQLTFNEGADGLNFTAIPKELSDLFAASQSENSEDDKNLDSDGDLDDGTDGDDYASGSDFGSSKSKKINPLTTMRQASRNVLSFLPKYRGRDSHGNGIWDLDDLGQKQTMREDVVHAILLNELDGLIARPEDFMVRKDNPNYDRTKTESEENPKYVWEYPALTILRGKYEWVDDILAKLDGHPEKGTALFVDLFRPFIEYWSQTTAYDKKGNSIRQTFHVNKPVREQSVIDKANRAYVNREVLTDLMLWGKEGKINPNHVKEIEALVESISQANMEGSYEPSDMYNTLTAVLRAVGIDINSGQIEGLLENSTDPKGDIQELANAVGNIVSGLRESEGENPAIMLDYRSSYEEIASIVGEVDETLNRVMSRMGDADYPSYGYPSYLDQMFKGIKGIGARPTDENDSLDDAQDRAGIQWVYNNFADDEWFYDKATKTWKAPWLALLTENSRRGRKVRQNFHIKYINTIDRVKYADWTPGDISVNFIQEYFSVPTQRTDRGLRFAEYALPIPSDSEMAIFIRMPRYADEWKTYVNRDMIQLVKQEIFRIKKVKRRKKLHAMELQNYDSTGDRFRFIPGLNETDILEAIDNAPEGTDVDALILSYLEPLNEARFERFYKKHENIQLTHHPEASQDEKRAYLEEFFYNNTLAQAMIIEMCVTDIAYFKDSGDGFTDFQKRFKQTYASGPRPNTQSRYGRDIERSIYLKDFISTSRSYVGIKTALNEAVKNHQMTEAEMRAILKKFKNINGTDAQAFRSPSSMRSVLDMYGKWDPEMADTFDRFSKGEWSTRDMQVVWGTIKPFLFGNVFVNDGLGGKSRTPVQHKDSEYLLLSFLNGLTAVKSPQMQAVAEVMEELQIDVTIFESGVKDGGQGMIDISYNKERLAKVKANESYWQNIEDNAYNEFLSLNDMNEEAAQDSFKKASDIQKYKAAHDYQLDAGLISQEAYNKAMDDLTPTKEQVKEYLKSAILAPNGKSQFENYKDSHPEVTDSTAEDFINRMEKELDAAEKLFKQGKSSKEEFNRMRDSFDQAMREAMPTNTYDSFTNEGGHTWVENKSVVHEIPYSAYMEAQPMKQHGITGRSEAVYGSQFRNLIYSDMDPNMVITIQGKPYRARNDKGKNEILELYQRLITENLLSKWRGLQKEFRDIHSLQKALINMMANNPSYGEDVRSALDIITINDGGKTREVFNIPLCNPTIANKIEQLVLSMFKSRITKQRIRGTACVLVSDVGYSNELHIRRGEQGEIKGFECKMPASFQEIFEDMAGSTMHPWLKRVENENGGFYYEIDVKAVEQDPEAKELLEGVGYRIPTEGKYSMVNLIVTDFLPVQQGAAIMMPAECTTLAGWDFDVDKLFLMLKAYRIGEDGLPKVIKYDVNKAPEEQGDGIINDPDYATDARNNMLIDIARTILAHPSTAAKIDRPGNYDNLGYESDRSLIQREYAIEWAEAHGIDSSNLDSLSESIDNAEPDEMKKFLKKYKGKIDPLDLDTFIYYHNQNMTGGKLIGIYANNTTAQGKYQQSDLGVDPQYGFTIDGFHVSSLSNAYRVDAKEMEVLISGNCSETSAASVDNVKDPKLANLMQNPDNAFVTGTMLRMGLTLKEIGAFFSLGYFDISVNKAAGAAYGVNMDAVRDYYNSENLSVTTKDIIKANLVYNALKNNEAVRVTGEGTEITISDRDKDTYAKVTAALMKILTVAPEIRTLTQISRADSPNGAIAHTIAGAINQIMKVNAFHQRQERMKILMGTEKLIHNFATPNMTADRLREIIFSGKFDMPLLQSFYTFGIETACDSLSTYFNQVNPVMRAYIDFIWREHPKDNIKDSLIRTFLNEAVVYGLSKNPMFSENMEGQRAHYIYEFPQQFRLIKTDPKFSKFSVIRSMIVDKGDIKIMNLPRLIGVADEFKRELDMMLFSDDPDIRNMAIDLFKYSYFKDGLGWRVNGFSKLFNTIFLENLPSYISTLRSLTFDGSDGLDWNRFMQQFITNHASEMLKKFDAVANSKTVRPKMGWGGVDVYSEVVKNPKNHDQFYANIVVDTPKGSMLFTLNRIVDSKNVEYANIPWFDSSSSPIYDANKSSDQLYVDNKVGTEQGIDRKKVLESQNPEDNDPDSWVGNIEAMMNAESQPDIDGAFMDADVKGEAMAGNLEAMLNSGEIAETSSEESSSNDSGSASADPEDDSQPGFLSNFESMINGGQVVEEKIDQLSQEGKDESENENCEFVIKRK